MDKEFQQALSDFTFEVADGGAIRHLTDLGYTVKQIRERLDFPIPYARIQEAVWKRLVETGVISLEEPFGGSAASHAEGGRAGAGESRDAGTGKKGDTGAGSAVRVNYVREYDSYGRASFRRVTETVIRREAGGEYLACEFGVLRYRDEDRYRQILALLEERQAEYIHGLPWPPVRVWHRAEGYLPEVERRLRAAGMGREICWQQGNPFASETKRGLQAGALADKIKK